MSITLEDIGKYEKSEFKPNPIFHLSDEEFFANPDRTYIFDIECYENFFLAAFMCYETGKVIFFERSPDSEIDLYKLQWLFNSCSVVGFNSHSYDIPLCWAAIEGLTTSQLKELSDQIINEESYSHSKAEKDWDFKIGFSNHIDIKEVAPGVMIGLKHYGGRMHVDRLQELPINPHKSLTQEEAILIKDYCVNDLIVTANLYYRLEESIKLRNELGLVYEIDLRSKSDAQIAEKVLVREIEGIKGKRIKKPKRDTTQVLKYKMPSFIKSKTKEFKHVIKLVDEAIFELDSSGKPQMPSQIKKAKIQIGSSVYNMGIGGLHSTEKRQCYVSDNEFVLIDRDVASYYPQIILNQRLYPDHIGEEFLQVYQSIVDKRLNAKELSASAKANGEEDIYNYQKNIADSLKITINGAFGKLGSEWSLLYAPRLLLQVTLTGQLSLLMLIEIVESEGISVVSANTDGIVIRCPRGKESHLNEIISQWEKDTGFLTEEVRYRSIYSRDVNNYIAIGEDNSLKAKGSYVCDLSMKNKNRESLMKNPEFTICNEAVMKFLRDGESLEKTIRNSNDISKFVSVRKVTGGAEKDGVHLGKVIRWYMKDNQFGSINYSKNGNKVPNSEGGYPAMCFNKFPQDVDYAWYHQRCVNILKDIGYNQKVENQLNLFG